MKDRLLSIPEVARELGGISVWTVRAWLMQGRMRRTKVGRRTMVRFSELARVISDDEHGSVEFAVSQGGIELEGKR
jgi:excisionase family DNA binding protein